MVWESAGTCRLVYQPSIGANMSRIIPIATLKEAKCVHGGLTQTSKMPCKSYSLPTASCNVGSRMAQVAGSVCSKCYAQKGFYSMYANSVEPSQHARLVALEDPLWVSAMVRSIGADSHFRWHDSGDLRDMAHLELIASVATATPNCSHWLPTREYAVVKAYIAKHGALPGNLTVRLSAMFPDVPVTVPASLRNVKGVAISNVHTGSPMGQDCNASKQGGACLDCRDCWDSTVTISYKLH